MARTAGPKKGSGVGWQRAVIWKNGKFVDLGSFATAKEASDVYEKALIDWA